MCSHQPRPAGPPVSVQLTHPQRGHSFQQSKYWFLGGTKILTLFMQKVHLGSIYHKYIQNIAVELLRCHRQEQLRKKGLKRPGGGGGDQHRWSNGTDTPGRESHKQCVITSVSVH